MVNTRGVNFKQYFEGHIRCAYITFKILFMDFVRKLETLGTPGSRGQGMVGEHTLCELLAAY